MTKYKYKCPECKSTGGFMGTAHIVVCVNGIDGEVPKECKIWPPVINIAGNLKCMSCGYIDDITEFDQLLKIKDGE